MKETVTIGPGIGVSEDTAEIMRWITANCPVPLIIDADGINSLSENIDVLYKNQKPIVLKPHIGQMGMIAGDIIKAIPDALKSFTE